MNHRDFDIADFAMAGFALLIFVELFACGLLALAQGPMRDVPHGLGARCGTQNTT